MYKHEAKPKASVSSASTNKWKSTMNKSCYPNKATQAENLNESTIVPCEELETAGGNFQSLCFSKVDIIRQDRHGMYVDRISKKIERISMTKNQRRPKAQQAHDQHNVNKLKEKVLPEDDFENIEDSASSHEEDIVVAETETLMGGTQVISPLTEHPVNAKSSSNTAKPLKVIKQELSKISWRQGDKSRGSATPPTKPSEDTTLSLNTVEDSRNKTSQTIFIKDQVQPAQSRKDLNINMRFLVDSTVKEESAIKQSTLSMSPSLASMSTVQNVPQPQFMGAYPMAVPMYYGVPMHSMGYYPAPPYPYQYQCQYPAAMPAQYYYPSSICCNPTTSFWNPQQSVASARPFNLTQNVAVSLHKVNKEMARSETQPQIITEIPKETVPEESPRDSPKEASPRELITISSNNTTTNQFKANPKEIHSPDPPKTQPLDVLIKAVPNTPPVLLTFDMDNSEGGKDKQSLAEMFKLKKKNLAVKFDQASSREQKPKVKMQRTKEEILSLRREMMHPKLRSAERGKKKDEQENNINMQTSPTDEKKKDPPQRLLERLAMGTKPKINKEEMHKLTSKNYELLPEVKLRKEMERKKQERKDRIDKAKKFEKVIYSLLKYQHRNV